MDSTVLFILEQFFIASVIIFLIAIAVISMLRKKNFDTVYKLIYKLVCRFEKAYGISSGDAKYTEVVQKVYEMLPIFLRILFSHHDIDSMIETAVKQVKTETQKDFNEMEVRKNDQLS